MNDEKQEQIEYKNLFLFFETLYSRVFGLMNSIIDEKTFNIIKVKDQVQDFCDSYAYYIIGKDLIKDPNSKITQETNEIVLNKIKDFNKFTETLDEYPSQEYMKIHKLLKHEEYDLNSLSPKDYSYLIKEYYLFFNKVILIIRNFIKIFSINGFLPVLRSKKSLRTIGFANYDLFFTELTNLNLKLSEITTTITTKNMFKSRRAAYCMLVALSPYFKRIEIFEEIKSDLDFSFLNDKDQLSIIKKSYGYANISEMGVTLRKDILDILTPFKTNMSYFKRYLSLELGEIDINPFIKKKYSYDPTWT